MRVCGIKLTHDGGVAVIEGGRLLFSIEMEKLANAPRYSNIKDLSQVFELLHGEGLAPSDIDIYAVDGWRKTEKVKPWQGQDVRVQLAPYRRGLYSDDPLQEYRFRIWDFEYRSYPHYSSHIVGGYCTSPFAAAGEASVVVTWDGAMFPFLAHVDPRAHTIRTHGPLFDLLGDAYHTISQRCDPFDAPIEWPATLNLAGKIMAYIARGQVKSELLEYFGQLYARARKGVLESTPAGVSYQEEPVGRAILERVYEGLDKLGMRDADVLASWHEFLGQLLVRSLGQALAEHQIRCANLVLVGGCALNIKWNRSLRDSGLFEQVWVPPFPNDAGAALGAAACAWSKEHGLGPIQWDVYSGPTLKPSTPLSGWSARSCRVEELAAFLHERNEVVVFLHGRAELGPRALGHRSMLAPAVSPHMKAHLNAIKGREDYRPVAPICLEADAPRVFEPGTADPYMLFDHRVRPEWLERVPAIVHEDGTARLQTISPQNSELLYRLLTAYRDLSGIPLLCNTSANHSGRGFFPDARSAMEWGKARHVWCDDVLYTNTEAGVR